MTSTSDSERHTEYEIIIQMGKRVLGGNGRLIFIFYNDMRETSVNNCRMKSKDGYGWWRILEETSA